MTEAHLVTQPQFKGDLWRRQYNESRLICWLIYLGGIGYRVFWFRAFQENGYMLLKCVICSLLLCNLSSRKSAQEEATTYRERQTLTPCHWKSSFLLIQDGYPPWEITAEVQNYHGPRGNGSLVLQSLYFTFFTTGILKCYQFPCQCHLQPSSPNAHWQYKPPFHSHSNHHFLLARCLRRSSVTVFRTVRAEAGVTSCWLSSTIKEPLVLWLECGLDALRRVTSAWPKR